MTEDNKLNLQTWDISKLKNWDNNPREVTQEGFERLKKQIQELDVYKPLLIHKDGTVLGGNMRLRAFKELGIKKISVSIVDASTEEQKIKYALSDNDQVGRTDKDKLLELIENYPEIKLEDYAIHLEEPQSLDKFMEQFKEVVEDDVPDISDAPAVSKLGEVYQLGRHRLMCGDATKIEDVEKLMNGQKADMVFTDPPYGMDLDTDYSDMRSKLRFATEKSVFGGTKHKKVIGDDKPFNYQEYAWLECKEQFWWGGDYYVKTLSDGGSWFVWDKRVDEQADKMYGSCFELCWSKEKHRREIVRVKWAGIFGTEQEFDHKRYHPTQKPINLAVWFINKFSQPEQKIIDLFGGSGSTLIACEQTNRICYMMEIDPKYCDVIRKRYENFIKNRA